MLTGCDIRSAPVFYAFRAMGFRRRHPACCRRPVGCSRQPGLLSPCSRATPDQQGDRPCGRPGPIPAIAPMRWWPHRRAGCADRYNKAYAEAGFAEVDARSVGRNIPRLASHAKGAVQSDNPRAWQHMAALRGTTPLRKSLHPVAAHKCHDITPRRQMARSHHR